LKKLELPQYNKNVFSEYLKKDNFEWIEIDEIFNCKYDPDLTKLLKKPDIQKIITTLKMQAKQTSDGIQTKSIEFSDSDDDE
jgi:hypothetical protein